MKDVCIVHFNTPELTRATIRSLWKNTPDCRVVIFDNSTTAPFGEMDGVEVIDNTKGQILDFQKMLSRFPRKRWTMNDWGSAKHSYTIDYLFSVFPEGFVLMDSDILVKDDISGFFDQDVLFVGKKRDGNGDNHNRNPRLLPFLCWINVPMCRAAGIKYFDPSRSWKLHQGGPDTWYDTGSSFFLDCLKSGLPVRYVDIDNYMIHFYGGSYKEKDWRAWLAQYKGLYE